MKIIKIQESTDGKGSMINRPAEPFPLDTVYTTMINNEYICYQVNDTLPHGAVIDPLAIIKEYSS